MRIKIKSSAVGGYGGLNDIALREDGWEGLDHILEADDKPLLSGRYRVFLPAPSFERRERFLFPHEFIIVGN